MSMIGRYLSLPALVLCLAPVKLSEPAPATAARSAEVYFTGLGRSGHVNAVSAFPGETISLPVRLENTSPTELAVRWLPGPGNAAPVRYAGVGRALRVNVPLEPGVWSLEMTSGAKVWRFDTFHVLVEVPAAESRRGSLHGYRVGSYPAGQGGRYAAPDGFIRVTPANQDMSVSRSFRLRDFLTHDQADTWPKFVLIDERLLDKLELLRDELRSRGIADGRFTVMSGFRTPQYNAQGLDQGRATLSRHQYGDAADVWVDDDRDGVMDDLNGDGLLNREDARFLARIAERVEQRYPELAGGLSAYAATSAHGPFLHVDARGTAARW